MPSAGRFRRGEGFISKSVEERGISVPHETLNAVDFIESHRGLSVRLFPVQRLIIKCVFGVPMDYKEKKVPLYDVFRERLLTTVTESEALHIFHEEGRCNIGDWRDIPERGYNEACIIAGRRGGKSQLVSAMAAYKLYLLLNFRSPQEYFDLVPNSHIDFTFLAQDEEGSDRLYDKLREDVNRAPFFAPFFKAGTGTWMGFITESDRGKRDVTPTVNVDSHPCTTRSVRSPSSLMLALDEFAHFRSEKGSTSDEVYQAATPSTLNFHHAELLNGSWISQEQMKHLDPPQYREFQDSLIVSISSPWTKVGKMYDLHRLALDKGKDSSIFTLRVSTAEMNPTVLPKILHEEHEKSPMTFRAEYGGQFLDSSETYVTEATIRACTDVRYTEGPDPKPIPETARLNLTVFALLHRPAVLLGPGPGHDEERHGGRHRAPGARRGQEPPDAGVRLHRPHDGRGEVRGARGGGGARRYQVRRLPGAAPGGHRPLAAGAQPGHALLPWGHRPARRAAARPAIGDKRDIQYRAAQPHYHYKLPDGLRPQGVHGQHQVQVPLRPQVHARAEDGGGGVRRQVPD